MKYRGGRRRSACTPRFSSALVSRSERSMAQDAATTPRPSEAFDQRYSRSADISGTCRTMCAAGVFQTASRSPAHIRRRVGGDSIACPAAGACITRGSTYGDNRGVMESSPADITSLNILYALSTQRVVVVLAEIPRVPNKCTVTPWVPERGAMLKARTIAPRAAAQGGHLRWTFPGSQDPPDSDNGTLPWRGPPATADPRGHDPHNVS